MLYVPNNTVSSYFERDRTDLGTPWTSQNANTYKVMVLTGILSSAGFTVARIANYISVCIEQELVQNIFLLEPTQQSCCLLEYIEHEYPILNYLVFGQFAAEPLVV